MVTITGYRLSKGRDDKEFISLQLHGEIELVQSLETGHFYATARKASITSTFSEETAKGLIGTKLAGKINRVESEAYDYTIPETGEVIKLMHRYEFHPDVAPYAPTPGPQFTLKRSLLSV